MGTGIPHALRAAGSWQPRTHRVREAAGRLAAPAEGLNSIVEKRCLKPHRSIARGEERASGLVPWPASKCLNWSHSFAIA